jgi:hypothetical protein
MSRYPHTNGATLTRQIQWTSIGSLLSSKCGSKSAFGVTERSLTAAKALVASGECIFFNVLPAMNNMEFRIIGATNDADVDIEILASRYGDDNLVMIGALDVIIGTQTEFDENGVLTGGLFADQIAPASGDLWVKTIFEVDPGSNCMSRLALDACGYPNLILHGYGTFDENVEVQIAGF